MTFIHPNQRATDAELMEALKTMSMRQAAKHFGMNERTLYKRKAALARKGFSPEHDMTKTVPDGYKVKGVSTYYDQDGKQRGQWVKSSIDEDRQYAMMMEAVAALCEEIPRLKPMPASESSSPDLLNCYVISDYHFGMKSWHEETGGDYDLNIAESLITAWFQKAIDSAPAADVGVFAQLGDFLHYSGVGLQATTESSGHILDADGRFQKMLRVVIKCLRRIIDMLLVKHKEVHVKLCEGNHDISASAWLREMFYAMYENEPRISVDRSPDPYYAYEFGKTMLCFHHGHKRKVSDIAPIFVAKFREMFGRTSRCYAHMGHLHHIDVKENSLMVVEQHRTLAAPDAYASRGGWLSDRDAKVITYHREFGEVGRLTINIDMLK